MSKKRATQHIDEDVAKRVRELHKKHPQLGSDGIGRLLEDAKIYVDGSQLKAFLKTNKLTVAPPKINWQNSSDGLSGAGAGLTKKGSGFD
jgi:hypothetical protein